MFQIQRYDSEEESTQDASNAGNELLTKINERVQLKRKRTKKHEQTTARVENVKEYEIHDTTEEIPDEHNSPRESNSNEQEEEDNYKDKHPLVNPNSQNSTEDLEEHDVLLTLPEFEQPERTPQETASVKLLGIPDWLAHPITIEPDVTLTIDHPSLRLSERLVKRSLCFTKSVDSARRLAKLIQLFENLYAQTDDPTSTDTSADKATNQKGGKLVITAAEYSSDLSQEKRKNILRKFKRGEIRLLANYFKGMLTKAGHMDKVKNIKINLAKLNPLRETYKESERLVTSSNVHVPTSEISSI
ncbi:11560_t:CDS:2, partial [Acaulospora colombiana]